VSGTLPCRNDTQCRPRFGDIWRCRRHVADMSPTCGAKNIIGSVSHAVPQRQVYIIQIRRQQRDGEGWRRLFPPSNTAVEGCNGNDEDNEMCYYFVY